MRQIQPIKYTHNNIKSVFDTINELYNKLLKFNHKFNKVTNILNKTYMEDNIIYEPNFTSGDSIANDAIYSFRVPIFGSGNVDPSLQTKTGTFNWIFDAMDMSNTYSDTVIHRVIVE